MDCGLVTVDGKKGYLFIMFATYGGSTVGHLRSVILSFGAGTFLIKSIPPPPLPGWSLAGWFIRKIVVILMI